MTDRLNPGQSLFTNNSITSGDGRFHLILQTDGNLVIYRNSDNRALWATGTQGTDVHRATMQTDGNLVIYQPIVPVWASNTVQH